MKVDDVNEILLLTVEGTGQAGNDLLIFPLLPADDYCLDKIEKIKIVTPNHQVLEKEADFSIPLGIPSRVYLLLIPNTPKDQVPIGSQIWVHTS